MLTFRLVLIGWSLLCFAGWLVLGGLAEREEAACRAAGGFLRRVRHALGVIGLIAFGLWLVGTLIAWGAHRIDATTTVVTVRNGATVTQGGRVYRAGERIILLATDAAVLRQSNRVD